MSYNLTPKLCAYCGRHADAGSPGAMRYAPMTMSRPVFGKPQKIDVCRDSYHNCIAKAEADGYELRIDLIPKR